MNASSSRQNPHILGLAVVASALTSLTLVSAGTADLTGQRGGQPGMMPRDGEHRSAPPEFHPEDWKKSFSGSITWPKEMDHREEELRKMMSGSVMPRLYQEDGRKAQEGRSSAAGVSAGQREQRGDSGSTVRPPFIAPVPTGSGAESQWRMRPEDDDWMHRSGSGSVLAPEKRPLPQFMLMGSGSQNMEEMRKKMDEMQKHMMEVQREQMKHAAAEEHPSWDDSSSSSSASDVPPAGFEQPIDETDATVTKEWFTDVSSADPIGAAANDLATRGIVGGFADGTFRPDQTVNRAELAKFLLLARYNGIPDMETDGSLSDVKKGEWYVKYVVAAKQLGIIGGYSDGTFKPGKTVNTAEFLKMLTLTFKLDTNLAYTYGDVSADAWYAQYAGVAERYKLFPDRGTTLNPESPMTRGEVVYAIEQMLLAQ